MMFYKQKPESGIKKTSLGVRKTHFESPLKSVGADTVPIHGDADAGNLASAELGNRSTAAGREVRTGVREPFAPELDTEWFEEDGEEAEDWEADDERSFKQQKCFHNYSKVKRHNQN